MCTQMKENVSNHTNNLQDIASSKSCATSNLRHPTSSIAFSDIKFSTVITSALSTAAFSHLGLDTLLLMLYLAAIDGSTASQQTWFLLTIACLTFVIKAHFKVTQLVDSGSWERN